MKTITITAGHSNTDPGACNGPAREADIAQDMRNMVALYLERAGIPTRTDGTGKGNGLVRQLLEMTKALVK